MKVLVRYLHERLLFRISASPYKSHFLLKGSSLLFALDGFKARPTIDIDLLGERINNDRNNLKEVFQKVCAIECDDDGVTFDATSLELEQIDKELLAEAIVGTFKNRNTPYRENLALFTDKFATDATRNIWWKAFLKKIRWKEQIDFSVVMKCIKENLQAYWNKETLG